MRHVPMTEQEINALKRKLAPGLVKFQVKTASDQISKSGNEMIKLVLECWDHTGLNGIVFDYLLSPAEASDDNVKSKRAWKLSSFCKSIGEEGYYKNEVINPNFFEGKSGECNIAIEAGKDGYDDTVRVSKYIPKKAQDIHKKDESKEFDDDVPF